MLWSLGGHGRVFEKESDGVGFIFFQSSHSNRAREGTVLPSEWKHGHLRGYKQEMTVFRTNTVALAPPTEGINGEPC